MPITLELFAIGSTGLKYHVICIHIYSYTLIWVDLGGLNKLGGDLIGVGLFVEAAFFKHSCRPNAERRFKGTKMQVFALDRIDTLKEHVTIAYEDSMVPFDCRKELLKYRIGLCKCIRCDVLDHKPDDDLCKRLIKITNSLHADQADPKENSKISLEAVSINEKVLGKYSIQGTCATIIACDNLYIVYSIDTKPALIKLLGELLLKQRDCMDVTHPFMEKFGPEPRYESD